jgi:hypothetical protein
MSKDGLFKPLFSTVFLILNIGLLGSCMSSARKERLSQQQQIMNQDKFYCEFLNGEKYTDIDVALNVAIGQKCDTHYQFSVTGYRSVSEIPGIVYCCSLKGKTSDKAEQQDRSARPHKTQERTQDRVDAKPDIKQDTKQDAKPVRPENQPEKADSSS